jgi:hypothetical protein
VERAGLDSDALTVTPATGEVLQLRGLTPTDAADWFAVLEAASVSAGPQVVVDSLMPGSVGPVPPATPPPAAAASPVFGDSLMAGPALPPPPPPHESQHRPSPPPPPPLSTKPQYLLQPSQQQSPPPPQAEDVDPSAAFDAIEDSPVRRAPAVLADTSPPHAPPPPPPPPPPARAPSGAAPPVHVLPDSGAGVGGGFSDGPAALPEYDRVTHDIAAGVFSPRADDSTRPPSLRTPGVAAAAAAPAVSASSLGRMVSRISATLQHPVVTQISCGENHTLVLTSACAAG